MDTPTFTPRQRLVFIEMCRGATNKQIAKALSIAEATVKLHLTQIFKTMGVTNRSQALVKANGFCLTVPTTQRELTDLEILTEFTDMAFTVGDERWSQRVLKFGRAIDKRTKGNMK